jgi:hypothetical protein
MQKQKGISTIIGIIIIAAVAVILFGGVFAYQYFSTQQTRPTACTKEAKVCPDGSSVYRTEPNCEFTQCPATVSGQLPINIKPNQIISLPFTLTGKASNQFEGQWGNVKMYDSLNNLLTTKIISTPCDYGKSCDFSLILNGTPKTNTGYLIFSQDNPSGLAQYENSYRINIGFNDQTAGWKTYTNTQYGFEIKFPINEIISPNDILDNVIEQNFYYDPSYKEIVSGALKAGCLLRIYPNIDDKFLSVIKNTDIKQLSILEHNSRKYFIGYNAPSSAIRVNDCILAFNKIIPTFRFTK